MATIFSATIKLGEHNLKTSIDCEGQHCADPLQIIYPLRIIVPSEFSDTTMRHDIALIELAVSAKITRYVEPVCLPSEDVVNEDLIGKKVEIVS